MLKHRVQFEDEREVRDVDLVKCRVKIYKIDMQRCPYIHEMKERLLGEPQQLPTEQIVPSTKPSVTSAASRTTDQSQPAIVGTVVKLNPDGFGSHTSPTHLRTPLMQSKQPEEEFHVYKTKLYPKNAKTSLFIIMSFVYAKLLIVICLAYVFSHVITRQLPLFYYEGFFTYLYGTSILFLLYVFCFLLQESSCCAGAEKKVKAPSKQAKEKEKERKKEVEKKKKEEKEQKKKEEKEKKEKKNKKQDKQSTSKTNKPEPDFNISFSFEDVKREKFPRKRRDTLKANVATSTLPTTDNLKSTTYRRNSDGAIDAEDVVPLPVTELSASQGQESGVVAQAPPAPPAPPPSAPATQPDDLESGHAHQCKRKTTQNEHSHGSFFLRIGAIAFGLGTMIYNGLEFGKFFETPFNSPCHMILQGVNPVLQMVFTFMQMYFIFMNSRLNIHRFKVVARFGLMHVAATNVCVWIRTLVLEYIKEVTNYHLDLLNATAPFADGVRRHALRNAHAVLGTHLRTLSTTAPTILRNDIVTEAATTPAPTVTTTVATTTKRMFTTSAKTMLWRTTTAAPATTTLRTTTARSWQALTSSSSTEKNLFPTTYATFRDFFDLRSFNNIVENVAQDAHYESFGNANGTELLTRLEPAALLDYFKPLNVTNNTYCGKLNIMGSIVEDSAPYLFPFIIEYSLIGAAVIYCMWKHIGRNPRYVTQEDLEHRLEIMLSRRAVAMAHAQQGRVDCVGASKGLFFGLLMLVASLICLILFFVLIHHKDLGLLAIYLADVSHCVLMAMSVAAILIGFVRVQSLKFRTDEQSDLNDILLRVSAFGLFAYAIFSVIAGHFEAFTLEPNMLVMITGALSVLQVVLQLLFIADVSRRRVHLPEHDRTKPGRQVVTFLLICNITMWIIYTFEQQKVEANPVQKKFYGFLTWAIVQRCTLPLCIFHRFHSAVALAEIWKTTYKARLE